MRAHGRLHLLAGTCLQGRREDCGDGAARIFGLLRKRPTCRARIRLGWLTVVGVRQAAIGVESEGVRVLRHCLVRPDLVASSRAPAGNDGGLDWCVGSPRGPGLCSVVRLLIGAFTGSFFVRVLALRLCLARLGAAVLLGRSLLANRTWIVWRGVPRLGILEFVRAFGVIRVLVVAWQDGVAREHALRRDDGVGALVRAGVARLSWVLGD